MKKRQRFAIRFTDPNSPGVSGELGKPYGDYATREKAASAAVGMTAMGPYHFTVVAKERKRD